MRTDRAAVAVDTECRRCRFGSCTRPESGTAEGPSGLGRFAVDYFVWLLQDRVGGRVTADDGGGADLQLIPHTVARLS